MFVKKGPISALAMFEAEVDGLNELRSTKTIRVPDVLGCGIAEGESYLALEQLSFDRPNAATEQMLGEQLAELHRHTERRFGWFRDNTIGLTPQKNDWSGNWIEFFTEHRLGYQLARALEKGYDGELDELGGELCDLLPAYFEDYEPTASLLHGDLWSGNWGSVNGKPVIFDPAVYYGDRESDIAMTRLFGGFGAAFYEAYASSWPFAGGHEQRSKLYQLYHVLNHLNLFGDSYQAQATSLMRELL